MITAEKIIQKLDLKPMPDGLGFYRQTYQSCDQVLPVEDLGSGSSKPKQASTAIYYLVTPEMFSTLNRVASGEIFHFYGGDAVEMIQIDQNGDLCRMVLGKNILNGDDQQIVVPKGVWKALRLQEGGQWALMGATVAPGFEFEDFELGNREKLLIEFPEHRNEILRFTR